jgi:16S rRNA (guanine527-N7)-methyltransferase
MLLAAVPAPGAPLLDIGSGPGVPGLIVKLARPAWEVVLVEASRRRANFLRHVVRMLGLAGVEVRQARAEALAGGALAGRFRTVTLRAVAPAPRAVGLGAPFVAATGVLVLALGPAPVEVRWSGAREVRIGGVRELPWSRHFLIIPATALGADVSRGTRAAGARDRDRQPEGRRREDDDRP